MLVNLRGITRLPKYSLYARFWLPFHFAMKNASVFALLSVLTDRFTKVRAARDIARQEIAKYSIAIAYTFWLPINGSVWLVAYMPTYGWLCPSPPISLTAVKDARVCVLEVDYGKLFAPFQKYRILGVDSATLTPKNRSRRAKIILESTPHHYIH
jgi:hypothetical protein